MSELSPEVWRAALTMLFFGVVAVVLVCLAAGGSRWLGVRVRDGQARETTLTARVTGRRSRMLPLDEDVPSAGTETIYGVTFEPNGGRPMETEVPKAVYDDLTEGDHGYLTVRGREFVSFVKDE